VVPPGDQVDIRATAIELDAPCDVRHTLMAGDPMDRAADLGVAGEELPDEECVTSLDECDKPTNGFRPRVRPPVLVLRVLDDNQKSAENVRIRGESFKIGRDQGDLIISHDYLMSGMHASILRRRQGNEFEWYLCDLQSRNGVFVKVDSARLKSGDELLLGSSTFRFFEEDSGSNAPARLVEHPTASPANELRFERDEVWFGRVADAAIASASCDRLLERQHARFFQSNGRWCVAAAKSRNGVWIRVAQVRLQHGCWFQLGEQRFQVLIP
jgi:pSer/pThr/pTyr-binding forkhead associated (FHA) protein